MTQPTLLVLAAGIGSRYGGLKQVDGMGPGGESILEYSVFDALRAGFGKVVFVIRKDIEAPFREKVGRKVEPHIQTEYAFQELSTGFDRPEEAPERLKPWGTGHAVLAAGEFLTEPFVTINADDFYGAEAFQLIGDFLRTECTPSRYGMIAYRMGNTLSENGAVSRGVCAVDKDNLLVSVTERTHIERLANGIAWKDESGAWQPLADDTPVSMNFWGFHHTIIGEIRDQFREFVEANRHHPKAEFYIPTVVNRLLKDEKIDLKVRFSEDQWYGVTYPEDKDTVQAALEGFVEKGIYMKGLWG